MTSLTIGQHRGQRTGDLIELEVHGTLTLADVTALRALALETLAQEQGRCFLIADVTAMTGIDADARRQLAAWSKVDAERLAGTAIHGCGFAIRALLTLTLNAIKLFGRHEIDTVFASDGAEARSWIAAQRVALEEKVQHGG